MRIYRGFNHPKRYDADARWGTNAFEPDRIRWGVDSISTAKTAILSGLGIQHLPTSKAEEELNDGRLVHVLLAWSLPDMGVYAVRPNIGPQKKLTHRLIDFLIGYKSA